MAKQKAIEEKAKQEREKLEAENAKKLKAEQDAKAKLEAELKAKKDAEEKARLEAEKKAEAEKKEAEKLAKAPIKTKLNNWVKSFELPNTDVDNATTKEINQKFDAFKKWANSQIELL